jgi:hypothetical protein
MWHLVQSMGNLVGAMDVVSSMAISWIVDLGA